MALSNRFTYNEFKGPAMNVIQTKVFLTITVR